jgi:adenine-specific DNA-methyltransferase
MPTLSWLTREKDVKSADAVAYRLLERDEALSYGDVGSGNMLIQGDNLEALKSLLPYYRGQVKCIYIDPPYNTRSAFEHYDDNLEHSQWLAMIWPRLILLRELLAEDGSIWVSIDDNEGHYLKVIMDEVFGRRNFISNVVWQKKYAPANDAIWMSDNHDHIMVFAKDRNAWRPRKLPRGAKENEAYKNPDNDPRGPWKAGDYTCAKSAAERPNLYYPIIQPNTGEEIWPKKTRVWGYGQDVCQRHAEQGLLWWGKTGLNKVPSFKRHLTTVEHDGVVAQTIWLWSDVGHTQDGRKEQLAIMGQEPFGTPKPEKLMKQIVEIGSAPGDLVLDSFLGSGTTAAVAHKMGRRWIGIEMGDHAVSHCAPRLRKVIDSEQGGISEALGWKGGGGFAFHRLGEAVFDDTGAINPGIAFAPLAAHIWFAETGQPMTGPHSGPFLGSHDGSGLALLYNGILGDKSVSGGNVLTRKTLGMIRAAMGDFIGSITVYGEACRLSPDTLKAEGLSFKQTPYDVRAR